MSRLLNEQERRAETEDRDELVARLRRRNEVLAERVRKLQQVIARRALWRATFRLEATDDTLDGDPYVRNAQAVLDELMDKIPVPESLVGLLLETADTEEE